MPDSAIRMRIVDGIGETSAIEVLEARTPALPTLAHVHRDEHTALAAAKQVARERGAKLLTLSGERERRISFATGEASGSFDPNRVFTKRGRELTVASTRESHTQAIADAEEFSRAFCEELGAGPWIAAHNNSPGPPLSIRSFLPGANGEHLAADLHVAPNETEDDFALVTTRALFEGYRAAGYNVVLQAAAVPDDGSLSVLAAQLGVPYVNVEALEEHFDKQVRLLRLAFDLLARDARPGDSIRSVAIALNIDLGELPDEPEELYRLASWANLACGGHAGDLDSMRRSLDLCRRSATQVGAHPSFADREHFGRRMLSLPVKTLAQQVEAQLTMLRGCASEIGVALHHVKAHGALYHALDADPTLASGYLDAVERVLGTDVIFVGSAGGALAIEVRRRGLRFARELFADRGVDAEGKLLPRGEPGAVVSDPVTALRLAQHAIEAGECETLCVHGDNPAAVSIARAVRSAMELRP